MTRSFALPFLALLVLVSVPYQAQASNHATIRGILEGNSEFSLLVTALRKAGLLDALPDADSQAVMFAPTNAFLLQALGNINLNDFEDNDDSTYVQEFLRPVLMHHVVTGISQVPESCLTEPLTVRDRLLQQYRTAESHAPAGSSQDTIQTCTIGNTLTPDNLVRVKEITVVHGPDSESLWLYGKAPGVQAPNFRTPRSTASGNARVYPIRGLLIPLLNDEAFQRLGATPLDFGASSQEQKVLTVRGPDFGMRLQTVMERFKQASSKVAGLMGDNQQALTYFIPAGDAMNVLNLIAGHTKDVNGILMRIMDEHVLLRAYDAAGLQAIAARPSASERQLATLAGVTLELGLNADGQLTVSGDGNTQPATVILANVPAGKSIIHLVDTVLLPEVINMDDHTGMVAFADGSSASALTSSVMVLAVSALVTLVAGML